MRGLLTAYKAGQELHQSCLAIARREAPGLGIPIAALYKNLRRTGGDLEAAVERYLKNRPDNGGKPVTWQGRTFATRREFTGWLAHELRVSDTTLSGQLYRHKWDIAATIAHFHAEAERIAAVLARRAELAKIEPELAPMPELTPDEEPEPALDLESELALTPDLTSPGLQARTPDPCPAPRPRGRGSKNGVPVLYDGVWFDSKAALARHIAGQGVLAAGEVTALLYPPVDEDVWPRLDYFTRRIVRRNGGVYDPIPGPVAPLIYAGRLYPSRAPLARWLSGGLGVSAAEALAILFGLAGDVTAEVAEYCSAFGLEPPSAEPDAPLLSSAVAGAGLGNGHAPPTTTSINNTTTNNNVAGGTPAPALAGPLAVIASAFATQEAELADLRRRLSATTATGLGPGGDGPILRYLQEHGDQLARLTARLAQLERIEGEKRQALSDQAEMVTVILHKVGQVAHDLDQMRNGKSPPQGHTRRRPLGTD
jgi:hypothetical protein